MGGEKNIVKCVPLGTEGVYSGWIQDYNIFSLKHWDKETLLEWVSSKNKLSFMFTPIFRKSQCKNCTLNPIMSHSREIWTKVHKMY